MVHNEVSPALVGSCVSHIGVGFGNCLGVNWTGYFVRRVRGSAAKVSIRIQNVCGHVAVGGVDEQTLGLLTHGEKEGTPGLVNDAVGDK